MIVQVNGKLRDKIVVNSNITKEDILLNASSLDGKMYVSEKDYTIK